MIRAEGLHLLPQSHRQCGSCAACCYAFEIEQPELTKPGHTWCQFSSGHQCAIYKTRPALCRSYRCMWLDGNGPREAKPSQSGWIMDNPDNPIPSVRFFHWSAERSGDRGDYPRPQEWAVPIVKRVLDGGLVIQVQGAGFKDRAVWMIPSTAHPIYQKAEWRTPLIRWATEQGAQAWLRDVVGIAIPAEAA